MRNEGVASQQADRGVVRTPIRVSSLVPMFRMYVVYRSARFSLRWYLHEESWMRELVAYKEAAHDTAHTSALFQLIATSFVE